MNSNTDQKNVSTSVEHALNQLVVAGESVKNVCIFDKSYFIFIVITGIMQVKHTDRWYAGNAVRLYRQLGWVDSVKDVKIKLIHPEGRQVFHEHGVVFIDGGFDGEHYFRLCVLFPGQRMRMHHHEKRREVFKVIAGNMLSISELGEKWVPVDAYLTPEIGEKHGVATDTTGCAYVGYCHKDHMTDVHWMEGDSLVAQSERVTVLSDNDDILTTEYEMPDSLRTFTTSQTVAWHLRDVSFLNRLTSASEKGVTEEK